MNIVELNLDEVESLWQKLNALHHERSTHFKDHFAKLEFIHRKEKILANEHVAVFGAEVDDELTGYAIVVANEGSGEIYSLFIDEQQRGSGVGQTLVEHSIRWLQSLSCENIRVYVAEGNEQALPFYDKMGFKPRFHVLQYSE